MKHEEISLRTKISLSKALKKLLEKKPLNKITVADIIKECNVNRNTFYYHFSDIYDLFQWTLEYESVEVIKQFDLAINFEEALAFTIDYIKSNKHILNSVYDTLGQEKLKQFVKHDFENVTKKLVDVTLEQLDRSLSHSYKEFLIQFYSSSIANTFIAYICGEFDLTDQQLTTYLSHTIQTSLIANIKSEPK